MSYSIRADDGTKITITGGATQGIRFGTEFDGCSANVDLTSDEARYIAAELLIHADAMTVHAAADTQNDHLRG